MSNLAFLDFFRSCQCHVNDRQQPCSFGVGTTKSLSMFKNQRTQPIINVGRLLHLVHRV